jgi:hypothetical protein
MTRTYKEAMDILEGKRPLVEGDALRTSFTVKELTDLVECVKIVTH